MSAIIGWDLGGAHLKVVRVEQRRVVAATQVPSPLWLGLARLTDAFGQSKARMGMADRHVVTMTGELADVFSSRTEGVQSLAEIAAQELRPAPVSLYAGRAGFVPLEQAQVHAEDIASANWHASASLVARCRREALVVDMGSTTTDLVPVAGGMVRAEGYSDAQRLVCGELVYTGLVRTFLMAIADHAPVAGKWTPLMKEYFASTADVHRILGGLPDNADQQATADGREKTAAASSARLARMVGRDASEASGQDWEALARWFAEAQLRSIADAAMLVLSRGDLSNNAPILIAGIGDGVIAEVARRLGRSTQRFSDLLDATPDVRAAAAQCAPAAAIALLAAAL